MQQVLAERQKIMLKVGQFELPYAYSPLINRVTASVPLLFGAEVQSNDVVLGGAMRGFQLSGLLADRLRWYLAYGAPALASDGNLEGNREFFGVFRDFFLRIATPDPARNIGFFAYFTQPPRDPSNPATLDRGRRYGLDAAIEWNKIHFYGTFVYGENTNPTGSGRPGFLRSGFIEVDHMFLPWLGLTGRWDIQTIDNDGKTAYSDAKSIALRFYLFQHIQILGEYQQLDHNQSMNWLQATISF